MIRIRKMELSDLDDMIELFSDKRVFEQFDTGPWPILKIKQSVERNVAAWTSGGIGAHVIQLDEKVIGKLIVFPNGDSEHELGFVIKPRYWNKGFATAAGNLAIEFLDESKDVDFVIAFARSTNGASIKVLETLGFNKVGKKTGADGIRRKKYHRFVKTQKQQI